VTISHDLEQEIALRRDAAVEDLAELEREHPVVELRDWEVLQLLDQTEAIRDELQSLLVWIQVQRTRASLI
jgi:hypothetical protein